MNSLIFVLLLAFAPFDSSCISGELRGTEMISYGLLIGQTPGQVSTTQVDAQGNFQLCNLSTDTQPVDVLLYRGPGSDTLYLGTVLSSQNTRVRLAVPAPLRTNLLGHIVCPKCHRADKTATIIYGDAPMVRQIVNNGDTTYTSLFGRKLFAGCINSGTKGYCSRDRIRF